MTAALETTPLYRFYRAGDEEVVALRGVFLVVEPGEVVAVVGPSGSGKSTLLACLAGTDEPDGGAVSVAGTRLSHRPEADRAALRGRHIGLMFQSNNLLGHLDVAGNIAIARHLAPGRTDRSDRDDLLADLGISSRAHSYPEQLSGGELARAALAVALANDPAVVIADEPTGELDDNTERQVLDLIRDRAAHGVAVVLASHSPLVLRAADRVITLADGAVQS